MTLIQLKERVDAALRRPGNEDIEVCIPNNKSSMGGISVTHCESAYQGFDWDKGKFIILPEKEMVERIN